VICEIQFHLDFPVFTWCVHVWDVLHMLLGRTFMFGLRTKKT